MIKKIMNRILRRQEVVTRCVAQFAEHNLHARVFEKRDAHGMLEYWVEAKWEIDGNEHSCVGLLRGTTSGIPFDVMRESHSYVRTLTR